MPITQDRVLDLLIAAEDFQAALQRACQTIQSETQRAIDGLAEPRDICLALQQMLTSEALLADPVRSNTTLALERQHFSKGRLRANIRARRRAKTKREGSHFDVTASET